MAEVFEQLVKLLDDVGISPDRIGQVETEEGCLYENDAPLIYQDAGATIVIYPDGSIFENGQMIAKMELYEDAWYQAKDLAAVLAF